jgi:hypothetical protein
MRTVNKAKASAEKSGLLTVLTPNQDSAGQASLALNSKPDHTPIDGLRFKLSARNGRHYFTDVRFSAEFIQTSDMLAVTKMLTGSCLEELSGDDIAAGLGKNPCTEEVQKLIGELQTVLCG